MRSLTRALQTVRPEVLVAHPVGSAKTHMAETRDASVPLTVIAHARMGGPWPNPSGRFLAPSQPSGPGLLEWVVLMLMARLAGELPAMVTCRHRVGKGQGQGIGKIG